MVQYQHVVHLVLLQYGVWIHFSFLIRTVTILTVLMILMAGLCFQNVALWCPKTTLLNPFLKIVLLCDYRRSMTYNTLVCGFQITWNEKYFSLCNENEKVCKTKCIKQGKKVVDPISMLRQNQEYYSNNANRILSGRKQYYVNNLDKTREKCRTYYAKNIESIRKKNPV